MSSDGLGSSRCSNEAGCSSISTLAVGAVRDGFLGRPRTLFKVASLLGCFAPAVAAPLGWTRRCRFRIVVIGLTLFVWVPSSSLSVAKLIFNTFFELWLAVSGSSRSLQLLRGMVMLFASVNFVAKQLMQSYDATYLMPSFSIHRAISRAFNGCRPIKYV